MSEKGSCDDQPDEEPKWRLAAWTRIEPPPAVETSTSKPAETGRASPIPIPNSPLGIGLNRVSFDCLCLTTRTGNGDTHVLIVAAHPAFWGVLDFAGYWFNLSRQMATAVQRKVQGSLAEEAPS